MYRYSVSFNNESCALPEWQRAAAASKIKRIELSCAHSTPPETLSRTVSALEDMQKKQKLEVASIHIPFAGDRWNIANLDESLRQANVRDILDFLKRTDPLDSKLYTIMAAASRSRNQRDPAPSGRCGNR